MISTIITTGPITIPESCLCMTVVLNGRDFVTNYMY
jgi:hypothetical protein